MFKLTDNTTGNSWEYETERQLKTVTTLYATQNPRNSLTVTVNGRDHKIR